MEKEYSFNISKYSNLIFFVALFITLFSNMVLLSMFPPVFPSIMTLIKYLKYLSIFLLLFKIIFIDKRSINNVLILLFIAIVFGITGKMAGNQDILTSFLFVCGVKNVQLKRIFKFTFFLTLGMLFVIILGGLFKFLPNLSYPRNGMKRLAMGTVYPTALSSLIFFNCSSFVCFNILNDVNKHRFLSFMYVLVSSFVLYELTNTRTDFICMILISILLFWKNFDRILKLKFIKNIIGIVPTIIFGWTLVSIYYFNIHNKIWLKLNDVFSGRLDLNNVASKKYPPKFLGQLFNQVGNGGTTKVSHHYFFIDSSFARVFFMNGIFAFVILYLLFQIVFIRIIRENSSMYMALLLVLSVSMIEAVFSADGLMIINSSLFVLSLGFNTRNVNNNDNNEYLYLKLT